MTETRTGSWLAAAAVALALLGQGCGPKPGPPAPGDSRGAVPDLSGQTVLVYPIQLLNSVPPDLRPDAEVAYALGARGEQVRWVFPPQAEEILARSPGVPSRLRNLPVEIFLQAQVDRIGDPLYGDVRRLAALTGAEVALLPVELRFDDGAGGYTMAAALLATRSGRVLWFGIVDGGAGSVGDPGALAVLAEALARSVLPGR